MDEKRKAAGAPAAPAGEHKPMKFCVLSHTRMGVNIEEFDTPEKRLSWLCLQSDVVDDFYILDAYSTRWRTRFHADGGQCSTVIADTVPL